MWANFLNEKDFLELRPGAFKELKSRFQEIKMLHKFYEKELGADRVKLICAEVNVKLGLQPGVSVNHWNSGYCSSNVEATITSQPMSTSRDSSTNTKPVAKRTSAGLVGVGVGAHDTLGAASSSTIVNPKGTNIQPRIPTDDVSQPAVIKKKLYTEMNNNNKLSASNDCEIDEDDASDSKTAVKPLGSRRTTTMMKHRRAPDSQDEFGLRLHCVCGYKCSLKKKLKCHLKRETFGKIFNCTYQNCGSSYGCYQFHSFKNHCMEVHQLKILNDAGCSYCGAQFKTRLNLIVHQGRCRNRIKLRAAMKKKKTSVI